MWYSSRNWGMGDMMSDFDWNQQRKISGSYTKPWEAALGQNSSQYIYGHHVPLFSDEPT